MPIYKAKCIKCGKKQDIFLGKVIGTEFIDVSCKYCDYFQMKKMPSAINNANFTGSSSRRSVKTRTGVGELQMKQGSRKQIQDTLDAE